MRWIRFAALAFIVHLTWEMGQMPLHRGMQDRPGWSTVVPCSRAALFDVALTLAVAMPFVIVGRRRRPITATPSFSTDATAFLPRHVIRCARLPWTAMAEAVLLETRIDGRARGERLRARM